MEFEWDEAKSDACLAERGFDFAYVVRVFLDPDRLIEHDDRFDYGELRYRALGQVEGRVFLVTLPPGADAFGSFQRARPISGRYDAMKRVWLTLQSDGSLIRSAAGKTVAVRGRIDRDHVDRTTEAEIARQIAADDAELRRDAAAYARRVRRKTGLTQAAFAARIGVPLDTVRNWEQGKRSPAGPAKALLRVLDRAPEAALAALD